MGGKSSDPNKAAIKAQREQMARLDKLSLPELQEYILQSPELVGLLEAEQLGSSSLEEISLDPKLREKQMQALAGLQERADQGLTAQDKLAMEDMLGQVGAQERAQRAAIESEMQRRGTADSGASLVSKLQSSQGGAQSARQQAMQMAAQGQQQRMAALQGLGQQAGQMESQDFSRQAQTASAKDAIARANAMNRQQVASANLAARQNIANQRANIANQQSQVANQIAQQNFANQMARATGQGQVASNISQISAAGNQQPSAFQSALGGAATGASIGGSIVPGVGAGYGAAIGAGAGLIGSWFEDGGIAGYQDGGIAHSKEMKAHEKFKSDYMKRVREELAPQKRAREEVTGMENGGVVHAANGLNVPEGIMTSRNRNMDFNNEGIPQFNNLPSQAYQEAVLKQEQKDKLDAMPNMFNIEKAKNTINTIQDVTAGRKDPNSLKDLGVEVSGLTNDKINEQDTTPTPKKEVEDSKIDSDKLAKGLGALSKMLGAQEQKKPELNLKYSGPEVQNIMAPVQAQDFGNIMAQQKFGAFMEDGGVADLYKGTKCAENGELMFDSEGDGAVVGGDSFERDRVDARLNSGEAVLNVAQQQRLMDLLRGKTDELGDEDIVEGVPKDYQEDLTEKIDNGTNNKVEGLKRLLSALGEG